MVIENKLISKFINNWDYKPRILKYLNLYDVNNKLYLSIFNKLINDIVNKIKKRLNRYKQINSI
ncbi:hypothetical protein ACR82Z_02850 [Mycoplasma sp. 6243]|uniref:hypothetical protein n=1 Tax=Mycoplasma sp. 6243 TaxID=3440865 RepID=UPI003EC03A34